MSGFFTRMAVNEVVLDYALPNISPVYGNNVFTINDGKDNIAITLAEGNYTVAALIDTIIVELNLNAAITFSTDGSPGAKQLFATAAFSVLPTVLSGQLSMTPGNVVVDSIDDGVPYYYPEILSEVYFDFTCSNLTYQQGLKDADTTDMSKDVLYRWVLSWDDYNPLDAYGYPIYQGYMPFKSRRSIAFPKHIKWDGQQPIGQLQFQVYNSSGSLAKTTQVGNFEWYMNLLVSEQ